VTRRHARFVQRATAPPIHPTRPTAGCPDLPLAPFLSALRSCSSGMPISSIDDPDVSTAITQIDAGPAG
jgi:hypothetical protein